MSLCSSTLCSSNKYKTAREATFGEFNKKWSLSAMVSTDNDESKFISGVKGNVRIPQKFCYYYSQYELENFIIPIWKKVKNIIIEETSYDVGTVGKQKFYKFSNYCKSMKKDVLITSCVHAREVATVTSTIAFIDNLITSSSPLLNVFNFHVCFIMNPRGYYLDSASTENLVNESGNSYRKNGNPGKPGVSNETILSENLGIDLNRNCYNKSLKQCYKKNIPDDYKDYYLFELNKKNCIPENHDTYAGTSPNSEIEIKNFIDYTTKREFLIYMDVHAYSNEILVESADDGKSGYKYPVKLADVKKKYKNLELNFSKELIAANKAKGGRREDYMTFHSNAGDIGYLCYGCINDYLCYEYLEHGNKLNTFTFEIGNDKYDRFYPSEFEMVDIIYNFNKSITKILSHYYMLILSE